MNVLVFLCYVTVCFAPTIASLHSSFVFEITFAFDPKIGPQLLLKAASPMNSHGITSTVMNVLVFLFHVRLNVTPTIAPPHSCFICEIPCALQTLSLWNAIFVESLSFQFDPREILLSMVSG